MIIEVFSRRNRLLQRRWYFRIVAVNGQIVAQSEAYTRKESAMHTAQRLREDTSVVMVFALDKKGDGHA